MHQLRSGNLPESDEEAFVIDVRQGRGNLGVEIARIVDEAREVQQCRRNIALRQRELGRNRRDPIRYFSKSGKSQTLVLDLDETKRAGITLAEIMLAPAGIMNSSLTTENCSR